MVTVFEPVLPLESVTCAVNVTFPDSFRTPVVPVELEEMTVPFLYLMEYDLTVEPYEPAPVAVSLH